MILNRRIRKIIRQIQKLSMDLESAKFEPTKFVRETWALTCPQIELFTANKKNSVADVIDELPIFFLEISRWLSQIESLNPYFYNKILVHSWLWKLISLIGCYFRKIIGCCLSKLANCEYPNPNSQFAIKIIAMTA